MNVYLIESKNGMLKIGTSVCCEHRAELICSMSPVPCRLIAKWRGQHRQEFALHKRFAAYRDHNEWFRIEGDLLAFVEEMRGHGLAAPPVDWAAIEYRGRHHTTDHKAFMSAKMKETWSKAKADPKNTWIKNLREAAAKRKHERRSLGATQ